jgi:short-subunit dehydrogenase
MNFSNAHILITGAASGIGLATARLLHEKGAQLTLWDQQAETLQSHADTFNAHADTIDITDAKVVQNTMAQATQRAPLTAIIHCAGVLQTGLLDTLDLEKQRRLIDINLYGSLVMAKMAYPHLKASHGSLILVASISGFYGSPEYAAYAATKAGIINLAQSLRLEWDQSSVHIGVLCPYYVDTPMVHNHRDAKLLKLFGVRHTPEQIAQSIVRALDRRSFMILPSLTVRYVWFMSHYFHALMYPVMRRSWRRAQHL